MKILIVPDVHGRNFWRKALEIIEDYDKVIFLGDYLDPYRHEKITSDMVYIEFKDILKFKLDYPEKITLLLGNHDFHYWEPDFITSTRYDRFKANFYYDIFEKHKELFSCFKQIKSHDKKFIFSHAGINKYWLEENKLTLSKLLKMSIDNLLDNKGIRWGSPLEQISLYRGGDCLYGSPIWADIMEARTGAMNLGDNILQITGHNQVEGIIQWPGIIYTDCKKLIALDTKESSLEYVV